jgi:hypothetical protein
MTPSTLLVIALVFAMALSVMLSLTLDELLPAKIRDTLPPFVLPMLHFLLGVLAAYAAISLFDPNI